MKTEFNLSEKIEIYTCYECEHCGEMYKEPKNRGLCPYCERKIRAKLKW